MNSKLQHGNKWSLQKAIFDKNEAIIRNYSYKCKTSLLLHLEFLTRISHHLRLSFQFANSKRLISETQVCSVKQKDIVIN